MALLVTATERAVERRTKAGVAEADDLISARANPPATGVPTA
jgi:hypothetical protein